MRGRVLPIGGLKEKLLAAKRAGLKTVILPDRNRKDIDDVPKHVRRGLHLVYAQTMDDVLRAALKRPHRSRQPHENNRPKQPVKPPVRRPVRVATAKPSARIAP